MKIQGKDKADLENLINSEVHKHGRDKLRAFKAALANDSRVKDVNRRFCFDILYGIPYAQRRDVIDRIYQYANDDHIYTALKQCLNGTHNL